jgi:hypothetical protein
MVQCWFRGTHLLLFFKSVLPESHWQILIVSNIKMNKRIRKSATTQKTIYKIKLLALMMRCQVLQSLCFPIFEWFLLITKEQCSVHTSNLNELVCLVFTKRVLLPSATTMEHWSMRQQIVIIHSPDSLITTCQFVGGHSTCIMHIDPQHLQ